MAGLNAGPRQTAQSAFQLFNPPSGTKVLLLVATQRGAEVILAYAVRVATIGAFRVGPIALLFACLAATTGHGSSCPLPRFGGCT
jgi:hypothetical protein